MVHRLDRVRARQRTLSSSRSPLVESNFPAAPEARRPLVAVLPFEPNGDDPALRLLGVEVADQLRELLAADPALQAILISSDFLAKAPPHALELICRELRIGHLISGKCHGTASEPSLYIELTDTREWHIHWANFYRGQAKSLVAADGEGIASLARELRRTLVEHPPR
jgi:TolB-like protein